MTISDDLKKSVACASIDPNVFKDHSISPFIGFTFNRSPEELIAIISPQVDLLLCAEVQISPNI